jgi:hypothetical protein
MIGFTKLLTGKATVAAAVRAADCGAVPPHLLQFSTASRPIVVWNLTWKCNLQCRHCFLEKLPDGRSAPPAPQAQLWVMHCSNRLLYVSRVHRGQSPLHGSLCYSLPISSLDR